MSLNNELKVYIVKLNLLYVAINVIYAFRKFLFASYVVIGSHLTFNFNIRILAEQVLTM